MASRLFARWYLRFLDGVKSLERKVVGRCPLGGHAGGVESAGPTKCQHGEVNNKDESDDPDSKEIRLLTDMDHFDRKGSNRISYLKGWLKPPGQQTERCKLQSTSPTLRPPTVEPQSVRSSAQTLLPLPLPPPPPPDSPLYGIPVTALRIILTAVDRGIVPPEARLEDWAPWLCFAIKPQWLTLQRREIQAKERFQRNKPLKKYGYPFHRVGCPSPLRNEVSFA